MYVITCTSYIARQNAWNVSCLCKFSHVLQVVCFIEPVNDQNYKMNLINSFNIKKTKQENPKNDFSLNRSVFLDDVFLDAGDV